MSRKRQPKLKPGEPRRLPLEHKSVTRKLHLDNLEGYVIAGLYEDGTVGEIFLTFDRVGSTERGLLNSLAVVISKALQRGVPLAVIVDSLRGQVFNPAGFIEGDPDGIKSATSIVDLLAKWLSCRFLKEKL